MENPRENQQRNLKLKLPNYQYFLNDRPTHATVAEKGHPLILETEGFRFRFVKTEGFVEVVLTLFTYCLKKEFC